MNDELLRIKNVTKIYPGVTALDNVSLTFKKGEVHGIVGENGAGKSTLIKTISGAITPDGGTIEFDGKTYTALDPVTSKAAGIGVIYQEFSLIPALTVAENIFLGKKVEGTKYVTNFKVMEKKAVEYGHKIGIELDAKKLVAELSVAEQQLVEITRALAENVKLLIMDEPSAPLTNIEIEKMFEIVKSLKESGITVIYISHRMDEIFRITDRVSVLMDGKYMGTVNTAETNRKELISMMVGRTLNEEFPERITPVGDEVLRVEHLKGKGVEDVSFVLHKGEILGFAGLLGCGRTETMEIIYGARKKEGGKVFLNKEEVDFKKTSDALKAKIGFVPEDRKKHGVFLPWSIEWNCSASILPRISSAMGVINHKKEQDNADKYIDALKIKTPSRETAAGTLSGGNQQKVVVAKALATDADVIIFDEPTRGIDVNAKQEIYMLMRELSEQGISIIMISSEMEEVMGMSDRIVVLAHGKDTTVLQRGEYSQATILDYASRN